MRKSSIVALIGIATVIIITIISICLCKKRSELLYYDIDVSSNAVLAKLYDEFVKDIDSTPEPPHVQECMSTQINKDVYERSRRKPTREELDEFKEVEHFLTLHGHRPWKSLLPEQDVDSNWKFRFGKYIRRNETSPRFKTMMDLIHTVDPTITLGGYFYYPKGGCREWHTNENDTHGWRGYFVYCPDGDNMSELNILDPKTKKLVRAPDRSGIIRLFKVGGSDDRLWHSVTSSTKRYSLGFRLPDTVANQLIRK